ncbi:MAG: hypothetical protein ACLFVO_20740 [Chloroflexaceae bacterium]
MADTRSLEQTVLDRLRDLAPEEQRAVFDFVEFLHQRRRGTPPYRGVKGLWADLDVQISAEEIDQARREMWGTFPREDIA